MQSRVYKTIRCPSVSQSVSLSHQSNEAAPCGRFAPYAQKDINRQRQAPGSSSAAARGRSTALSSQCHVDSRINEAEHRLGLLNILGLLKF